MSNIKFIVKNFIRENFILSLVLSKLSSVSSYLFDGIFKKFKNMILIGYIPVHLELFHIGI